MKHVGNLLSPNDPELVEKTLLRLQEQDHWNDVFSTKLIELLDTNDLLKRDTRDSVRRLEKAEGLVTKCEGNLARAILVEESNEKKLLEAVLLSELARKDHTESVRLLQITSLIIIGAMSVLSISAIVVSQLLRNSGWGTMVAAFCCIGIAAALAVVIWRVRRER